MKATYTCEIIFYLGDCIGIFLSVSFPSKQFIKDSEGIVFSLSETGRKAAKIWQIGGGHAELCGKTGEEEGCIFLQRKENSHEQRGERYFAC